MFIINCNGKYAKFVEGETILVDNKKDATKFNTEEVTKFTASQLRKENFKNVSYEEITE